MEVNPESKKPRIILREKKEKMKKATAIATAKNMQRHTNFLLIDENNESKQLTFYTYRVRTSQPL